MKLMAKGPGQPTKYKPEYCELLIEHMAKGLSVVSFAGVVGACEDTVHEWAKLHPEFKKAKQIGKSKSLLFWEKLGIDNIMNESYGEGQGSKSLNATVWIFNMKNRFGWRDKQPEENDSININVALADRIAKARARVKK